MSAVKKSKKKVSLIFNGISEADLNYDSGVAANLENKYFNRDISWIEFNARVICQAADQSIPLLERLKFLGIATNNFDEFFMKRVGMLQSRLMAGVGTISTGGIDIRNQISSIRKKIIPLLEQQSMIFTQDIRPELIRENIFLLKWSELTEEEMQIAKDYFNEKVFPLLTPLAVDAGHPFPFLSNLSSSLGFSLKHPKTEDPMFARVKIPESLPQWINLISANTEQKYRFISLNELIVQFSSDLFPGMSVLNSMPFKVTRNSSYQVDEEDAEDLLELIEGQLKEQRSGQIIRLEHGENPDPWILSFLIEELQLNQDEIYELKSEFDFKSLEPIYDLNIPKLRYPRFSPSIPAALSEEASMFHAIRTHDILVHHPYESFAASVERFVREASEDPKVMSIKMTVYRVGQVTPLIPYLINAAEQGKQVVCMVELKARFDEKQNIHWANTLEKAGVHVVYGIPGLKTHAKAILVIRQDTDCVRAYAHCGTGNYHTRTANLYTDLGLFTANRDCTAELMHFFNYLTGRSLKDTYKEILVAPLNMEKNFLSGIQNEIENHKQGRPAHIMAKMNSLEDQHIIDALYAASQAGVKVDLIVRGICCLKPGVPGLSDNIRVISVVGRLLEHSRIFYFRNSAADPIDGNFYIGSADWMHRNLHRRIEIAVQIKDRPLKEKCYQIFSIMLKDVRQSWQLNQDGTYLKLTHRDQSPSPTHQLHPITEGPHELLMKLIAESNNLN